MAEALLGEAKLVAPPAMATRSTCGSWLAARAGAWSMLSTYPPVYEVHTILTQMYVSGSRIILVFMSFKSRPLARRLRRSVPLPISSI